MSPLNSKLAGTGKVYRFTLKQYSKNKANMIISAILLVAALVSVPVMSLVMGGSAKTETPHMVSDNIVSDISAVWIRNDTGYDLATGNLERDDVFGRVEFRSADFDANTYKEHIGPQEAFVEICFDSSKNSYVIRAHVSDDTFLHGSDLYHLTSQISMLFEQSRLQSLGITEDQLSIITSGYYSASMNLDEYRKDNNGINFESRFAIQYIYSFSFLALCILSTSYIIRSVIEEKDSRLVETLMVSVKPLALIAGKILAVMTYIFLLLVSLTAAFAFSWYFSSMIMDTAPVSQFLARSGFISGPLNISPMTIVIVLVSLALAYLTVSIITGISGSCCTSMEDMDGAYVAVVLIIMFGYLVSSITAFIEDPGVVTFITLFPVISIYTAPTRYILGDIGFGMLLLSWVIQVFVIAYLFRFCSKVYADLIIHTGSRIRFKELISMAGKGEKEDI